MPPTRKTHQNAISGITKDRVNKPYEWNGAIRDHAKNKLASRGLEISDKNMNAIAAALQAKDNYVPEVEMVDAEVEKLKTLSDSIWASSSPKDAELSPNPADTYNKTVAAPEKRATVPALPRKVEVSVMKLGYEWIEIYLYCKMIKLVCKLVSCWGLSVGELGL